MDELRRKRLIEIMNYYKDKLAKRDITSDEYVKMSDRIIEIETRLNQDQHSEFLSHI